MTLANRLTLVRLALVPAFMAFMIWDCIWTRLLSLVIFIGASITDWYDGSIARRTGTVTVIGMFLDPLVDKMLIAAAFVGFVELSEIRVPAWMVVIIISREFLITGLRALAASRGVMMAAERAGKFKMVSQVTAIITTLIILVINASLDHWPGLRPGWPRILEILAAHAPYWLTLTTAMITLVSGYLYIQQHSDLLKKEFAMRRVREGRS